MKANKQAQQKNLIKLLNPKIRGWANYHRVAVAKETFAKVDNEIWKMLWLWARRRHLDKGGGWIRKKYFRPQGSRSWGFNANFLGSDGKPKRMTLVKASDTAIRRHVKIKMDANPFDPQWETYFEDRLGLKMKENLKGRRLLLNLWLDQAGKCPVCDQKIERETGWHVHHILPKVKGGKDNLSNLALMHPNCHRQIHSQRLEVVKPAPARGL